MKFYIIYSFDATAGTMIGEYEPVNEGWVQTEDDEQWEYDYLAEENPHNAHIWKDGIHRKYVHECMDKDTFIRFTRDVGLQFEDIETLGSLTDRGWMAAFSFNNNDDTMHHYEEKGFININAYVTPCPEPVRPMFTVTHPYNQEAFWPLSEDELNTYVYSKMDRYWRMLRNAFKNACN
jgi:hypothetical protein